MYKKRVWHESAFDAVFVPILVIMSFWVFVFPASYWVGWWPGYEVRMQAIADQPFNPAPRNIFKKYANLPDVKLTHILPAGVWSVCGAIQLLPRLRTAAPRLHRLSGRLLMACSALLVAGYVLMEIHEIVELAPEERLSPVDNLTGDGQSRDATVRRPAGPFILRTISIWFVITGVVAWRYALARRYTQHRRWAMRHMAAGGWVIVQRAFLGVLSAGSQAAGAVWNDEDRRRFFGSTAVLAISVTLAWTEVVVRQTSGNLPKAAAKGTTAVEPVPVEGAARAKADWDGRVREDSHGSS